MSLSLIAVFVPILLMGGHHRADVPRVRDGLSVAILISLVVSLTTTPMMCAYLLHRARHERQHGRLYRAGERVFDRDAAVLRAHPAPGAALAGARHAEPAGDLVVALNVYLFIDRPKGFFRSRIPGV